MNVLTHMISTVYSCMVLILPTGSFHFRGLIVYTVGDVTRVRVLSPLPSVRNPFYGFCDPEGSVYKQNSNNLQSGKYTYCAY